MRILVTAVAAILGFCVLQGSVLNEKMTVLQDPNDDDSRKVVVVTWEDEHSEGFQCQMFTDQKLIQEVLKTSGDMRIHRPTKEEMQAIREECDSFSIRRRRRDTLEEKEADIDDAPVTETSTGWNIIFPGTKWCGAGDIAKNDDDLGHHEDTDRCCRAHDKCDDTILVGETRHNLTNKSVFTKLSCECDDDFYECLSTVNSLTSNAIGNTYFNILRRPCYEKDYPKSKQCKNHTTLLRITCLEYERDTNAPQVYQWVSAKIYKHLPVPGPLDVKLRLSEEKTDLLRRFLP